jgi:1-phosphofructokinase family hexose kinase
LIVTLTANPAIDRTITVDRLVFEDRAYIESTTESAGGRGINASRVLHSFGAETVAILVSGGEDSQRFEALLAEAGFPTEVVRIGHEIRNNLTISDQQGLTVKLNERGPEVNAEEIQALERAVANRLEGAQWLMICGSAPPGADPDFYCRLIEMARDRGVKTLLDTDGDALTRGIEAKPTIVKPNQQEAERLLNRALITRAHFRSAVRRIKAMGAESVMLSLGSRGLVAIKGDQIIEATPPRIEALCPIGAGDASAAAFVWADTNGNDFAECLRWSVAAGTASARLPGVTFASLDQVREVYRNVEVKPVTVPV